MVVMVTQRLLFISLWLMISSISRDVSLSQRLLFMSLDDSETDSLGLREFYHFYEASKLCLAAFLSLPLSPNHCSLWHS